MKLKFGQTEKFKFIFRFAIKVPYHAYSNGFTMVESY